MYLKQLATNKLEAKTPLSNVININKLENEVNK